MSEVEVLDEEVSLLAVDLCVSGSQLIAKAERKFER